MINCKFDVLVVVGFDMSMSMYVYQFSDLLRSFFRRDDVYDMYVFLRDYAMSRIQSSDTTNQQ